MNKNFPKTDKSPIFAVEKKEKEMNIQIIAWILTVGFLFLIFIFRSIQKMRKETGDSKIFEVGHEDAIYDEYDDEEQ